MNVREMVLKILSYHGTYRLAETETGIPKSTLNDIYSGRINESNIKLRTYRKIQKEMGKCTKKGSRKSKKPA